MEHRRQARRLRRPAARLRGLTAEAPAEGVAEVPSTLFLAQPADEPSAARAEKVALPAISLAAAGAANAGAAPGGDISTLHVG
jgi:hypothetical protein